MVDVKKFVDDCLASLPHPDHLQRIEALLKDFMKDPAALKAALGPIDIEDHLLHQSGAISIYHIKFAPGLGYPPHNHGMPVVSGIYEGVEHNKIYKEGADGKIILEKEVDFHPHDTFIMHDGVHAASNRGDTHSLGFHIHVGDFYGAPHFLWDEKTGEKFPYSDKKFVELATYPSGYDIPVV